MTDTGEAMDDADENRWADPDTLLGLLQRGRGAGYRRSLVQRDEARPLVVHCITRDPRWDRQLEERACFYAALVAELNIDLSLLRAAYAGPLGTTTVLHANGASTVVVPDDSDAWLALEVFEFVARRGDPDGIAELRRYLRSARDVMLALEFLLPLASYPAASGLLADILETVDSENLHEALGCVSDFTSAPWPTWRRASAVLDHVVRDILSQRAPRPKPVPSDERRRERAVDTRNLLLRAGREAEPGTVQARLVELDDDRAEHTLLDIAPTILADPAIEQRVKGGVRRTLWSLRSPESLAWARATASLDSEGGLSAVHLLAERAQEVDLPQLRALLDAAVAAGNYHTYMYAQCSLVEGIGRLGDRASVAVIRTLFDEAVYSRLRERCARALSVIDGDFAATRAVECLYDSAPGTRLIAVTAADASRPDIAERLTAITLDPTEDEDVCRQAAGRLGET